MMLVLVACFNIGIAVAVDDEFESLAVSEGGNLTISIHFKKWDEDPQVLITRLKVSSQELIAQLICYNQVCERKCWISGVSLISNGENVTLILMNVNFSQTGIYKVCKLGDTHPENKIYNVTVYQPLPPAIYSKSVPAGITTSMGIPVLITAAILITQEGDT